MPAKRALSSFRKTDFIFPGYPSSCPPETTGTVNWKEKIDFSKITHKPLKLELISNSANPVLSDSKVLLKFAFCMLKNNTQADFQLKISTPGILAAVRRSGEEVIKIQIWCDLFCKIPLRG